MDGVVTNADSDNDAAEASAPMLALTRSIVVNATKSVNPGLTASMDIVGTLKNMKKWRV